MALRAGNGGSRVLLGLDSNSDLPSSVWSLKLASERQVPRRKTVLVMRSCS